MDVALIALPLELPILGSLAVGIHMRKVQANAPFNSALQRWQSPGKVRTQGLPIEEGVSLSDVYNAHALNLKSWSSQVE